MPNETQSPQTIDDKVKTDERIRGNHAWNTCNGGVRGLLYSAERVRELAEKKHKKNYWKIGALVSGGVATLLVGILYFTASKATLEITKLSQQSQTTAVSLENILENVDPTIEYYGVEEDYTEGIEKNTLSKNNEWDYITDLDSQEVKKISEKYKGDYTDKLPSLLKKFCYKGWVSNSDEVEYIPRYENGFFEKRYIPEIHCLSYECKSSEEGDVCKENEKLSLPLEDILSVKGVIKEGVQPYLEIRAVKHTIDELYLEKQYIMDNKKELDNFKIYGPIISYYHFKLLPLHGMLKVTLEESNAKQTDEVNKTQIFASSYSFSINMPYDGWFEHNVCRITHDLPSKYDRWADCNIIDDVNSWSSIRRGLFSMRLTLMWNINSALSKLGIIYYYDEVTGAVDIMYEIIETMLEPVFDAEHSIRKNIQEARRRSKKEETLSSFVSEEKTIIIYGDIENTPENNALLLYRLVDVFSTLLKYGHDKSRDRYFKWNMKFPPLTVYTKDLELY